MTVNPSFALIVQINRNPFVCSFYIGIFYISSSLRLLYCIATPLDGCEVLNFHGGSIIITSNILIPNNIWDLISKPQLKFVISANIGIALSPTWDFIPFFNSYSFKKSALYSLILSLTFLASSSSSCWF